ncbi:hypothetical protein CCACVL1_26870, partial [Corchorus capsularis]
KQLALQEQYMKREGEGLASREGRREMVIGER